MSTSPFTIGGASNSYSGATNLPDPGEDESSWWARTIAKQYGTGGAVAAPTQSSAINNASNGIIANAQQNGAAQATATNVNVDPSKTLQSMVGDLVKQDGAYMQQARGASQQAMNERGLISSSMAVGAAQDAVLGRAAEIASPDAATYANASLANANAANQASMFNAGQKNSWDIAQAELAQKNNQFNTEFGYKTTQQQLDESYRQKQLEQQNAQFQKELDFKINELHLQNDTAFNTQYRMYTEAIANIDRDPNLNAEAKIAAKEMQRQVLRDYVNIKGLNLDLNFSPLTSDTETKTGGGSASSGPYVSDPYATSGGG